MTNIIKFDFQGSLYSFNMEGWFNATEAARCFEREPAQWLRLPGTVSYLDAFKRKYGKITYLKTRRGIGEVFVKMISDNTPPEIAAAQLELQRNQLTIH